MNTIKFRAECLVDVQRLFSKMAERGAVNIELQDHFPDCVVTLKTPLSVQAVRETMRQIEDGHVMVETVELEKNYTGDRNPKENL